MTTRFQAAAVFAVTMLPFLLCCLVLVANTRRERSRELGAALQRQDYDAVFRLVRQGADVNRRAEVECGKRATCDRTPLEMAIDWGDSATIRFLLERGASPDPFPFGQGLTPLMKACGTGNVEAVRLLIAHGANVNAEEGHGFKANGNFGGKFDWEHNKNDRQRVDEIEKMLEAAGKTPEGT